MSGSAVVMRTSAATSMARRIPGPKAPFSYKVRQSSRGVSWIGAASGVALAALALGAGCATPTDASEEAVQIEARTGSVEQRIIGGAPDDDDASVPGVVALRVGRGGTFELCSGALLAPNVVLTARHCVSKTVTTSVSCDENGRSANGKHVASDEDPADVAVYVGASPSFASRPPAVAKAIVTPPGEYLCDSDIALVVLEHPVGGVEPLAVRLDRGARSGETIRAVGYGQNDAKEPIGTRFRKENVPVLAMGRTVSASRTPLGAHEFEVARSICQGDSGGPAISEETGAVIGVVSRGGGCDDDFGHIYTTTAGFAALFENAFSLAGTAPIGEGEAPPPMTTRSRAGSASLGGDTAPTPGGCSVSASAPDQGRRACAAALAPALALLVLASRRRSAR